MGNVQLGISRDGRHLAYDEAKLEFSLDGEPIGLDGVRSLDEAGLVAWRALEQRDWLLRIDADLFERCHGEALGEVALDSLTPEQRVIADAQRDDGVLAGKLVEADPALVQAVADELQRRARPQAPPSTQAACASSPHNPLAEMQLPRGMEALSQMERARGEERPMTRLERRLMKRILRNDDKAKAKRERAGALESPKPAPGGEDLKLPEDGRLG